MDRLRSALDITKQTFREWSGDKAPQVAAALAYYGMFALAPLLVLTTAAAGLALGSEAAKDVVVEQATRLVGADVAGVLETILVAASRPRLGILATVVSIAAIVVGALAAFGSVQQALDQIWEVEPQPRGLMQLLKERLPSFLLIASLGVLLVATAIGNTALAALLQRVPTAFPGGALLTQAANLLVTLIVLTVVFALVYKVLPDAHVGWRDVWEGSALTALLFTVGQMLIGAYLAFGMVGTVYGAAGSLVAVLVWLNYSGQVFLFGAELTQVLAARRGASIEPARSARRKAAPCVTPTGEGPSGPRPREAAPNP